MNKEKQIEEIAELERLLRIRRMDIEKQGCDIWALIKKTESEEQSIADYLIGQGYRKSTDVAREIDDLRRYIIHNEDIALKCKQENGEKNEEYWKGKLSAFKQIRAYIDAELKKKYTESEKIEE